MIEFFRIGFLSFTLIDLFDIAIVAILIFWLYRALKDTIAVQILFGLVILIGLSFFTASINLRSINWILHTIQDIWLLAFVILFQPELRKLMLLITRTRIFKLFVKPRITETLDEIVSAVKELSEKHIGALIVFPRSQNARMGIDSGISIQANLSHELLVSIFVNKSPLHDGAVVIENQTIVAARCILPLSNDTLKNGRHLGTRHRAALGLTEQVDAVVLVVSEETGWISIADSGELILNIDPNELQNVLKYKLYEQDI